ncbi:N-acetylmuramic acid 6-phosphate etherase [Candidatus Hydrogenedentota bacterium]
MTIPGNNDETKAHLLPHGLVGGATPPDIPDTELTNQASTNLDSLEPGEMVEVFCREDRDITGRILACREDLAAIIKTTTSRLRNGGRLFYVGAGTSGRLGVLDASECPPTFSTPPELVQAIIAGGPDAVFRAREGAEDDEQAGAESVAKLVHAEDMVVGLTASGYTPFVMGALRKAGELGAGTALVCCSEPHTATPPIDHTVIIQTGPEILTGSTRLKAGTATKMALNIISTSTMVLLGKTYGNLMVDLNPGSRKLCERAVRIIKSLTDAEDEEAWRLFKISGRSIKVAVVMSRLGLDKDKAEQRLADAQGMLRRALGEK